MGMTPSLAAPGDTNPSDVTATTIRQDRFHVVAGVCAMRG